MWTPEGSPHQEVSVGSRGNVSQARPEESVSSSQDSAEEGSESSLD